MVQPLRSRSYSGTWLFGTELLLAEFPARDPDETWCRVNPPASQGLQVELSTTSHSVGLACWADGPYAALVATALQLAGSVQSNAQAGA